MISSTDQGTWKLVQTMVILIDFYWKGKCAQNASIFILGFDKKAPKFVSHVGMSWAISQFPGSSYPI
jgi:hypothetical protein